MTSGDAIPGVDLEGVITCWNHGAERMYGYSAPEIVGRSGSVPVPPEMDDDPAHLTASLRRGERIQHYQSLKRATAGTGLGLAISSRLADPLGGGECPEPARPWQHVHAAPPGRLGREGRDAAADPRSSTPAP